MGRGEGRIVAEGAVEDAGQEEDHIARGEGSVVPSGAFLDLFDKCKGNLTPLHLFCQLFGSEGLGLQHQRAIPDI